MSKPKWYNWTGNSMWDEYCKITGIFIIIPCLLGIGFLIGVAL